MNRLFRAALVAALMPVGLGSVGCAHKSGANCGAGGGGGCGDHYRNWVDVSWPDRYNYAARQAVVAPFGQQAANGHFLHQTLWNFYFEPGSDKLTAGGTDKLDSLARATPGPDPRIYIQTSRDLAVTPENMGKVAAMRSDLDGRRAAAIRRYMTTQFGEPVAYEVFVHDAPVPSIYGVFAGNAYRGQATGYVGGLSGGSASISGVGRGSLSGPAPQTGSVNINQNAGTGTPAASPPSP
jgi:hypothetical protein